MAGPKSSREARAGTGRDASQVAGTQTVEEPRPVCFGTQHENALAQSPLAPSTRTGSMEGQRLHQGEPLWLFLGEMIILASFYLFLRLKLQWSLQML